MNKIVSILVSCLFILPASAEVNPEKAFEGKPFFERRILNHWDNLDGTVERGYAGKSIWKWEELPEVVSPRYAEYAELCAGAGINGIVLNNVNASSKILSAEYLKKLRQ